MGSAYAPYSEPQPPVPNPYSYPQAPAQNQGTAANPTTPNTQTELKPTETEAEIAASADVIVQTLDNVKRQLERLTE